MSPQEALRQFAKWALIQVREGKDIDGGEAQDFATELGLLVAVDVTQPCGDACACAEFDFPMQCFRDGPALTAKP